MNCGPASSTYTSPSSHKGQVNNLVTSFDPASQYLYYLTDEGSEFTRLKRYALADGRHEEVQKADWDVVFAVFSHNGRYRVTGINEDGRVTISMIDARNGRAVPLPSIPQGGLQGVVIARSESKVAFYVNRSSTQRPARSRYSLRQADQADALTES
ncbi:MAG: hypothetical protein EHM55_13765 [Acidobacteria bacterium]|nr:MAG: hypothetical protein EHM55_13765 [Acidobacteriota bacterium]